MNKNVSLFTGGLLFCTINPLVTNGLSYPYHLDESIFILGSSGVFFIFISFFDENQKSNQNSRSLIWGYSVCLFPIKRTPGLNELRSAMYGHDQKNR